MKEQRTPWQRLTGRGMYPVEYASLLLSPLRYLLTPPNRIADRLQLSSTDRVLEIGCGPGFFSLSIARKLSAGHLTLFDAQSGMLELASLRMEHHGLANYACACGNAERLPFVCGIFDVVFMVAVLGEVNDRTVAMMEIARVLRRGGRFSSTEAAGDPDRIKPAELDRLARLGGLVKSEPCHGFLVKTHTYTKPPQ
jgi:ubiquinone/menaquinone biosynthesis C-methylase UbiE